MSRRRQSVPTSAFAELMLINHLVAKPLVAGLYKPVLIVGHKSHNGAR